MPELKQGDTPKRFAEEMERVALAVQRELIRIGLLEAPEDPAWQLEQALLLCAGRTLTGRPAVVLEAALVVDRTHRASRNPREQAIAAFKELASAVRSASEAAKRLEAYVHTAANIGWAIRLGSEERRDGRAIRALFEGFNWDRLEGDAVRADNLVQELTLRREAALEARIYAAKGAGPLSHFCYELSKPVVAPEDERASGYAARLSPGEIAEIIGEVPSRSSFSSEERWEEAREDAAERVRQRIVRFASKLKASATL